MPWVFYNASGQQIGPASPALTLVPFSSGTTLAVPAAGSYVPVTSGAAGNKTATLPAALGTLELIVVTDRGAIAANPGTTTTMTSASTINGPAVINLAGMSLSFIDAAPGQWDSI